MHLAQELLMNSAVVVKEVSQRRQKSPEDEQHGNQSLEVDNDQLRAIIKADPLTTMLKLLKNSISTILWLTGI